MGAERKIASLYENQAAMEGAGVHLKRVFGFREAPRLDPFLLLDDFRSDRPEHYLKGFPWHPHRGIETITYMLKGEVTHGDSLGNEGSIKAGDVQWMTAGSGIVHQEMPRGDAHGAMYGFQLWTNLPAAQKMMPPRYREITAERIPTVKLDEGIIIKVIAGTVAGTPGPMDEIVTDPEYLDCMLPPNVTYTHATPADYTALVYAFEGHGRTAGEAITNGQLVHYTAGRRLSVTAAEVPFRFLLLTGRPLGEAVAWRGPIVMNTQAELDTAFREYREGTFIKTTR